MKDITPKHLRCSYGGCPAVNIIGDDRGLLVIGKKPSAELLAQIAERVGNAPAIVISAEYFANLKEKADAA